MGCISGAFCGDCGMRFAGGEYFSVLRICRPAGENTGDDGDDGDSATDVVSAGVHWGADYVEWGERVVGVGGFAGALKNSRAREWRWRLSIFRWRVAMMLVFLCALAAASAGAKVQPLTSLSTQLANQPALMVGTDWYPEQWPESRWEEDLKLMEAAHIRAVRLTEFAWSSMEPSEGKFEFGWLDRAIEMAAKHYMVVILGTPTGGPPRGSRQNIPKRCGWTRTEGARNMERERTVRRVRRNIANCAGASRRRWGDILEITPTWWDGRLTTNMATRTISTDFSYFGIQTYRKRPPTSREDMRDEAAQSCSATRSRPRCSCRAHDPHAAGRLEHPRRRLGDDVLDHGGVPRHERHRRLRGRGARRREAVDCQRSHGISSEPGSPGSFCREDLVKLRNPKTRAAPLTRQAGWRSSRATRSPTASTAPASRTLLGLHGGPGASSSYLDRLTRSSAAICRLVLYDQLGGGDSDRPDDPRCGRSRASSTRSRPCARRSSSAPSRSTASRGAACWRSPTRSSTRRT